MGRIYHKIFAKVYDPVMVHVEKYLSPKRDTLLRDISGKVLEVGAGTGVNLQYISEESLITVVEPSASMLAYAKKKAKKGHQIDWLNMGINDDRLHRHIRPESLDYVVNTLVLCTIPDPKKALLNYMKWLKPGGRLIVLEHLISERKVYANLQHAINPVWKTVGDGCHLNRHTDKDILAAGFEPIHQEYSGSKVRWIQAVYRKK